MTIRVVLTVNAQSNLRHYYLRAVERAPRTAARWLNRFHEVLQTLAERPQRCPLAPENQVVPEEIRQFRFGKRASAYRVLFTVAGDEVRVLHIRRASMDTASPDDLLD